MKITIIGGGNMGGAIADGFMNKGICKASDITVSHPREWLCAKHPDMVATRDNASAVADADMIVIAVKPWLAESVLGEIAPMLDTRNQCVVSVVAGLTFARLASMMPKPEPVMFRIIPNTAISVGGSVTLIAHSDTASAAQCEAVSQMFSALGSVYNVTEQSIGAATALTSCGIAYAFRYIEAAVSGALQTGIAPADAQNMVMETVEGAISLLRANGSDPRTEIQKVTTPGGITLKGLEAMERNGFEQAVIEGLKASK